MPAPPTFLSWVDANTDAFISRLSHAVTISGDPAFRPRVQEMSDWLNAELNKVGVETKQVDLGTHVMDGQTLPLPHAILGKIGDDKRKKTVLIYRHFDVQPASLGLRAVRPHHFKGWQTVAPRDADALPVNLRFCFEGMEENGSEGPDELVEREKDGWFKGVDCMYIWLDTRTPALTYGLRGLVYFKINVSGPGRDLHSGVFGRTVHKPMTDLISLMSRLVDAQGNILVPGVDDMVGVADVEERLVV
ncbi:hypothetical protein C8F04DRAFT_1394506 [Mycena alexandri]|uniref:Cytosolic nonspecific dipeptidase n=1 Tax=Mycena alexandri TaxID=1745969 RepID=A0AAD6SXH1_9AGAR|nr:hypothetical protein C8F04DRAFT_1394506 [Mycena alexandri]